MYVNVYKKTTLDTAGSIGVDSHRKSIGKISQAY
jgi:hypothetical protein